jgi:hypothetical protein
VYYYTSSEVDAVCLGIERIVDGILHGTPLPTISSFSFRQVGGCDIFVKYGQEPDEVTKQIDICNKKTEIETPPP